MIVLRWAWDFIRPHFRHHKRRDLYESHFLPTWALFVLRTLIFAYMLAITIYRPIDDSDDGEYLTYFTNINWILLTVYFGLTVLYTIVVHVMKWLGLTKESEGGANLSATANDSDTDSSGTSETDEEQGTATEEATDNEQTAAAGNHTRWTRFKKCLRRHRLDLDKRITLDMVLWMFFTLVTVNAVYLDIMYDHLQFLLVDCLLTAAISFWVAIYGTSDGDSNNESSETTITFYTINAHAINAAFVLLEIIFNKLRIYPFQIVYVLLFALAYMIFMWSWYGATDDWIYDQLSWDDSHHTLYYFGVLGALVGVFAVLFLLTRLRDVLARVGKRKLSKRRARKQAAKQNGAGSTSSPADGEARPAAGSDDARASSSR
ncbi:uncharacterized protein ACA1_175440 [Acanthamoeba castellanii str. Neff]|uniref:Uncharacterized protein n=1 Tax=Acanthamoeba castellanii (strain ATCC 30010 / Neff) TaxID=1257118 RepID=L8HH20_ACACF|nr:uncharacterized protein ACA1_175440 [Acanthamoeba castellanii str. Neff]ELR24869.1 hypothetical protein ACA1_175440 [Acanthamoeba castellanii str. Neff]